MKSDADENSFASADDLRAGKSSEELWHDAEKKYYAENEKKRMWMFIALAILCIYLFNAKHKIVWVPDPNDQQMRVDYSDWWGVKKQTFYPVWRKPSGEEQEADSEQWCIKYPDGTWQVFLDDDGENVYYEWPEKGYSSPQKK